MKFLFSNLTKTLAIGILMIIGSNLNGQCNANYTYSASGNTVSFTNTSTSQSGKNSFEWYFGDPSFPSYATNPTHTYSGPGTYWVCLMMNDTMSGSMCDSICKPIVISIASSIKEKESTLSYLENYPNPFTTTTTIYYSIKQDAAVELYLLDVLGKKVAIIEN